MPAPPALIDDVPIDDVPIDDAKRADDALVHASLRHVAKRLTHGFSRSARIDRKGAFRANGVMAYELRKVQLTIP
jgi:hypothetical protein